MSEVKERFVVCPDILLPTAPHLIILVDYEFWANNVVELVQWCDNNDASTEGMVVICNTDAALTAFALKWS